MLKSVIKSQEKNTKEKEKKKDLYEDKTIKKIAIGTCISTISSNVNRLNSPTKEYRLAKQIQNQD